VTPPFLSASPPPIAIAVKVSISRCYHAIGEIERSKEYLNQLEKLANEDTKARYSLAMNYAETDRHDEALQACETVLYSVKKGCQDKKGAPFFDFARGGRIPENFVRK